MAKVSPAPLLKNLYFDATVPALFAKIFAAHYRRFDSHGFVHNCLLQWESLELKQRMERIVLCLHRELPSAYHHTVEIITRAAPLLTGLRGVVLPTYVQTYGVDDPDTSVPALEILTQYSTAEFAIRPFLVKYPARLEQQMLAWTKHNNEHVRRLSSEGMRPRLPWAAPLRHFIDDPGPILPVLHALRKDHSEYVRKSVGNCLNDIAKDHPDTVVNLASKWYGTHSHTNTIVLRAVRTLIKQGRQDVLELLGQGATNHIHAEQFGSSASGCALGEHVYITARLGNTGTHEVNVRIGFAVDYRKANGSTSRKVFAWKNLMIPSGVRIDLRKKLSFTDLTTRKHYSGRHDIHLIVNGVDVAHHSLNVT